MAGRRSHGGPERGAIMAGMPWQLVSVVALVCFSAAFLAFRAAGNAGVGSSAMLLLVMLIGAALTVGQMAISGSGLALSGRAWLLVGGAALACWVGNLAQLDAVSRAPNPGAALAIINASVAVVALASWPVFAAPLSAGKGMGVALCLAGVILVSVLP